MTTYQGMISMLGSCYSKLYKSSHFHGEVRTKLNLSSPHIEDSSVALW